MDNSNIIISVIIVLCIAAGVTAYSLTNNDNVFTDLQGIIPTSDDGVLGDNGVGSNSNGDKENNVKPNYGSSSSVSGFGSSHNVNSNIKQTKNVKSKYINIKQAKNIASSHIAERGCYIESISRKGDDYYCYVANEKGKRVDGIIVSAVNGSVGRG